MLNWINIWVAPTESALQAALVHCGTHLHRAAETLTWRPKINYEAQRQCTYQSIAQIKHGCRVGISMYIPSVETVSQIPTEGQSPQIAKNVLHREQRWYKTIVALQTDIKITPKRREVCNKGALSSGRFVRILNNVFEVSGVFHYGSLAPLSLSRIQGARWWWWNHQAWRSARELEGDNRENIIIMLYTQVWIECERLQFSLTCVELLFRRCANMANQDNYK